MKLRKLTLTAVLTAAALVMFVLESQLPPLTAIPGIKPGLSNIFTLFAMQALGPGWALGVLLVRVTLGCIITGQGMALLYSLTGGLFAYAGMLALRRWFSGRRLWILSVFCAMAHNFGQLCAAALIARTRAVWYYLPVLLPAAILAGALTGSSQIMRTLSPSAYAVQGGFSHFVWRTLTVARMGSTGLSHSQLKLRALTSVLKSSSQRASSISFFSAFILDI